MGSSTLPTCSRRCLLAFVLTLSWVTSLQLTNAALRATSVTLATLIAGQSGSVSVSFTSDVDIPVGGYIAVTFPTGFRLNVTTSVVAVDGTLFSSTLSVDSLSETDIVCVIGSADLPASSAFHFSISDVTNPGAGPSGSFSIVIQDKDQAPTASDTAVPSVTVASAALASVSVTLDSLSAGATATAIVSFTSGVLLFVGSIIVVKLPSELSVSATSSLSPLLNLDSDSSLTVRSSSQVEVFVSGSAIPSASMVSFKLSGVTNPGATTTDVFSVETMDNSRRVYEFANSVAGVVISSTALTKLSVSPERPLAGVSTPWVASLTLSVAVPALGALIVSFPPEFAIGDGVTLEEADQLFSTKTGVSTGNAIAFSFDSLLPVGSYTMVVNGVRNPGVCTTGSFEVRSCDSKGWTFEIGTAAGVTITAGSITDARFTPLNPHPGIASVVQLTFTTSAALDDDTLVYVALPASDYSLAVGSPTAVVNAPVGALASVSWDTPKTAFAILLSFSSTINEGTTIDIVLTTLNMPPSIRDPISTASIQTWNARGLRLDGPSTLALDAISAVTTLSAQWKTAYPYPGITSPVIITFATNGAVPANGNLRVDVPKNDFTADSNPFPTVVISDPSVEVANVWWDDAHSALMITLSGSQGIPSYATSITMTITSLDTPVATPDVSRGLAFISTFDPSGILIDGPSIVSMDATVPGPIHGTRLWVPVVPHPGVTSNHTIEFLTTGKLLEGSTLEFSLPNTMWSVSRSAATATFTQPNLGQTGSVAWNATMGTVAVTLSSGTQIPAYTMVKVVLSGITTPPKETAVTTASLITRSSNGAIIDGPGTIVIEAITRGSFSGLKMLASTTTTSASMKSKQVLALTLGGAIPSGGHFWIKFPSTGWRAPEAVSASFLRPATGVSISSIEWSSLSGLLNAKIEGSLEEATAVEIEIDGLVNPYDVETGNALNHIEVKSTLADEGVVNESVDVKINSITASDLGESASWNSAVATPGVVSTQIVNLRTGGFVEVGGRICFRLPANDRWTVLGTATASVNVMGSTTQSAEVTWTSLTTTVCVILGAAIAQESTLSMEISGIRTPPSERVQSVGTFSILSHLNGLVNTGSFIINPITRGQLSGERMWQSALFSPGPVAALATSATLTFATTGQIEQDGRIVLTLPIEWQLDASACSGEFLKPSVVGTVRCFDNTVTVDVIDTISESTVVQIVIRGIVNPPTVLPAGTASLQTLAADQGVIDESFSVSTGAIESALLDIISSSGGDTRVAVVGVSKSFWFQGFSVGEGDTVKFVDYSTTGDANCGSSTSGVSDVGGIDIVQIDSTNQAHFEFMQSSLDNEPFALCYKFGSNPFKLYRTMSFTVKELQSVSVSEGEPSIAVANYPKTWIFHGRGLAAGDSVRWVDASAIEDALARGVSPDCLNTATLARLITPDGETLDPNEDEYTRTISNATDAKFMFSPEENPGKTFSVCYRFGNEPYKVYPHVKVQVNHVKGMAAFSWGDTSVAVVDLPKAFNIYGEGLLMNDRVYFIEVGSATSCAPSALDSTSRFPHNIDEQLQTVLFLSGTSSAVVNFSPTAAGKKAMLCYQFGSEPYQLYPDIQLEIKTVTSFTGNRGSPKLAVGDIPEPLKFQGYGLQEGDQVRWIHSAEEDCDTHLARVVEPNTLALIDTMSVDIAATATFNFSSRQDDYQPVLCYKFGNENFKLYSNLNIKIGVLTAKSSAIGSKEVAVVDARKTFKLYGTHLAERDRVAWTRSAYDFKCENATLLVPDPETPDSEYVSFTNLWGEFSVAFAPLNSGNRVFLCYGFGSEPYKLYPSLFIDVKSIQNLRTLRGASDVAVAGALKTFLFEGDGVATGDYAKFVADTNTDCSAPGVSVTNLQKEFDDEVEMAVYLYENIPRITVGSFRFSATDPEVAGLGRVLCYRFGSEKFFFYKDFRIDVKTIFKLRQFDLANGGQASVAVVDEFKLIVIDGVGVGALDTVKWVDGATARSDEACGDLPAQGLFARTISVFANRTMWFPFEYGSQGKSWKLCYKFDQEPYRLYESITVTVKEITNLLDYVYQNISALGQTAIIGQTKTWKAIGSGVMNGDTVKFVPLSVSSSAECGVGIANIAGGSELMVVNAELIFTGTLTAIPVSLSDVYHVCYRFQDEPFSFVKGLEIASYGIWAIDRNTILSKASTPLRLNGFRLSNVDRIGWTADRADDRCLRMVNLADVFGSQAIIAFDRPYDSLTLCYSFDRQPFTMFKSITITVVAAEVWVPQSIAIVATQTVEVTLSGTFGLTISSDQAAWVPADAITCSQEVLDQYSSVMPSTVVTTAPSASSLARGGISVLSVSFAPSTSLSESQSTWKLCYKFGNVPEFLMFGDVICDVLSIQRVEVLESKPTPLGTTITFQFNGIGIQDFDVAKWIEPTTNPSDIDCESLPPVGGSAAVSIVAGIARIGFTQATSAMMLCYRFISQATFKLFKNIPIKDVSRSSGAVRTDAMNTMVETIDDSPALQYVPNRDLATVSLRLEKDISDIPPGSIAEQAFKTAFTAAIASSLGIDASRIEIMELLSGSVIVKFQLKPSDSVADPLVRELVADLQGQLLDPNSPLLANNGLIVIADPSAALNFEIAALPSDDSARNSVQAIAVRGYQRNGLFTFASDVVSVTEKTGRLFINVIRQQGVNAIVTLPLRLASLTRTATLNVDYRIVTPSSIDINSMFLRFDIGDQLKTIEIEILDDSLKEAHFESFTLILGEPGTPDADLGAFPETTVRLFDFDDGLPLTQTVFPAPTDRRFNLLGWTVVENGGLQKPNAQLRVDANGIFAIDQVVGEDEYNQKCDFASPTDVCSFACEVGASLTSKEDVMASYRVLSLTDGRSYVATTAPITSFATRAITVSFWIRTTSKKPEACIVAYSASFSASPGDRIIDFAVCDPTNLRVAIETQAVDAENHWGRRGALATFVDVTDGQWHFIAVAWNTDDGHVKVFDNGMLAFDGGPYRVGYVLRSTGFIVGGQLVTTSSCRLSTANDASSPSVSCTIEPKHGLVADLQHISIWTRVLSRGELLKQLQWPITVVTNGLVLSWNFDLFTEAGSGMVTDVASHGAQSKNHGYLFCSNGPAGCTTQGVVPRIAPGFPCGPVYANVWHFAAPLTFLQSLPSAYGGRLQFRMLAPSQNGTPRPRRGQVSLFGAGLHLSLALTGFPLPRASSWTYYSVVLREDFGWLMEPTGEAATASEYQEALRAASALWIRGDLWGIGPSGQGQEVVYLNDIKLFTR